MKYSEEQIEQLLDRVTSLLDSYDEADANYKDGQDRDHWKEKFGERLSPYSDKLKTLNGDDFDILEASRKEYHDGYSDLSDDEYVNSLEENIKKVLNRVWPEATEEQVNQAASQAAEQVERQAEAEEQSAEQPTEEQPEEDPEDEEPADGTLTVTEIGKDVDSEEEEEEDPTKAYVSELEAYKANLPKRHQKEEEE